MNKHKQFIKDCYNGKHGSICNEWKQTILNHYPEFDETIKLNQWYKTKEEKDTLWFINDVKGSFGVGYGFIFGDWKQCDTILIKEKCFDWQPATEEEVKTALIKEAKKRGFRENKEVVFTSPWFTGEPAKFKGLFTFDNPFELCLENDEEIYTLFRDGQWAEIVETITKEEAEKQLGKKII